MESVPSDSPAGTRFSYRRSRPLSTTTALDASSIGADVSSFSPKASTSTLPDNDMSIITSSHGGTRRLLELRAHTLGSSSAIGGGPDISGSSSSHKKRPRNARDFPPHLAAALGPTAFDPDNGDLVLDDDEYEQRKMEWAKRYTDVETLRDTFGTNRNQLWGDLDPETTRRLDDITDIYLLPPNEDPETCQVRGWFVDTCSSSFVQSSPTSQLSQRAPSLCEWKKVRRTRSFSITQHREVGGGCMRDIKKSTPSRTPLKRSCVQKAEVSLEPERHGVSISSASFKSK